MYSVIDYGKMIADGVRTNAYAQALRRAIMPESVVLELGTGIGFFALLACQYGAKHVYALEPANAIHVAQEIARAAGYANRIDFVQKLSTDITLPERADVIISDLRGVLPWYSSNIPSIIDARERLLKPGGTMIPQKDVLLMSVVESTELYDRHCGIYKENDYGIPMQAARDIVCNLWRKARPEKEQLLLEPKICATIDYTKVDSPNLHAKGVWLAQKCGTAHGLCIWFDTILAEGIRFSNSPLETELIYGSLFSPWPNPVSIATGDLVSVEIHANLIGGDYLWRWMTQVWDQSQTEKKADFRQSDIFSVPLSLKELRKRAASFVPQKNQDAEIDEFILSLMDGKNLLEEIAEKVRLRFPARFPKIVDALSRAGELSQKYSNDLLQNNAQERKAR